MELTPGHSKATRRTRMVGGVRSVLPPSAVCCAGGSAGGRLSSLVAALPELSRGPPAALGKHDPTHAPGRCALPMARPGA